MDALVTTVGCTRTFLVSCRGFWTKIAKAVLKNVVCCMELRHDHNTTNIYVSVIAEPPRNIRSLLTAELFAVLGKNSVVLFSYINTGIILQKFFGLVCRSWLLYEKTTIFYLLFWAATMARQFLVVVLLVQAPAPVSYASLHWKQIPESFCTLWFVSDWLLAHVYR